MGIWCLQGLCGRPGTAHLWRHQRDYERINCPHNLRTIPTQIPNLLHLISSPVKIIHLQDIHYSIGLFVFLYGFDVLFCFVFIHNLKAFPTAAWNECLLVDLLQIDQAFMTFSTRLRRKQCSRISSARPSLRFYDIAWGGGGVACRVGELRCVEVEV